MFLENSACFLDNDVACFIENVLFLIAYTVRYSVPFLNFLNLLEGGHYLNGREAVHYMCRAILLNTS